MSHVHAPDPLSLEGDCTCGMPRGTYRPVYSDTPEVPVPANLGVDDSHLKVPCPECKARRNFDCTSPFGIYVAGHKARHEAARAAA
jgi:hypothetical protein